MDCMIFRNNVSLQSYYVCTWFSYIAYVEYAVLPVVRHSYLAQNL